MSKQGSQGNQGNEESVEVVVLLDDEAVDEIDQVEGRLRDAGLQIEGVQRTLGTIAGRISPQRIGLLEKVQGVSAVERSRTVTAQRPIR